MTVDPATVSLSVHGAIAAAAVVGIWKLGGESKFGTEKINDLHALRPKLLNSVVKDLDLQLRPVLSVASSVEPFEEDSPGEPRSSAAKLSVTGIESLTNAVREFVKSNSIGLLDLREAQHLEMRLNLSMDRLRKAAWAAFASSGGMCLLMVPCKFEWTSFTASWIHATGFALSVMVLIFIAFMYWRILNYAGSVDRLKTSYADLS